MPRFDENLFITEHSISQRFIPFSSSVALFIAEDKKKKNAFILLLKEETSRFDKNLYLCVESLKKFMCKGKKCSFPLNFVR